MQDPPRVTIVDPSRPSPGRADEVGDDGRPSRRGLCVVLVLVALLLGWRAVDTVLDRRAAAVQERRLEAVVELELTSGSSSTSDGPDEADVAEVVRQLELRNTGPRPVEVLSASLGTLAFEGARSVQPGRDVTLTFARTLSCAQRPPAEPVQQTVDLSVRAADGTVVERRLPLPPDAFLSDPALLRRACGYLEPHESGTAFATGTVRLEGDALLADYRLVNYGRAPLALARLRGGSGMAVSLATVDGRTSDLPLVVPPGAESAGPPLLAVTLQLRVQDCAAVVEPDLGGTFFDESSPASIVLSFAWPGTEPDPAHEVFTVLEQRPAINELLRSSCG